MALHHVQPASVEEAITLLAASSRPVDSPTQDRIRTEAHLREAFDGDRRRPAWVWAVRRDDDPTPLGVVAAWGAPDGGSTILDLFDLPSDPDAARELVAHASRESGAEEALVFAPTGSTIDDPSLSAVVDPLRAAGWRLLVERRHYEFEAPPGLGDGVPSGLRFDRMSDAADPRLVDCHREVMRGTLDAYDRTAIDRDGFEAACIEGLDYLVTADPVGCIHLAVDPDGDVVGMISGQVRSADRGVVLFVGVAQEHRGHGYGRQLLAWQTRRLLGGGATTLIADTDNANVPMANGFAAIGWEQTETRIDLVR